MKKLLLTSILTLLALPALLNAAVIVGYDSAGATGGGTSPLAASSTLANTTASGLIRGSGIAPNAGLAANVYGGDSFDPANASLADAVVDNEFFSLTVKANSGFTLSLSSINYNIRRSSTGPNMFQFQYSIDGSTFTNLGTAVTYTGTDSNGLAQPAVSLTGITALQNVDDATTITIRLGLWGASATSGTAGIGRLTGNDFVLNGDVTAVGVPEPSTYAMLVGGAGLMLVMVRRKRSTSL